MIIYKLKCSDDHFFEAWFPDAKAYELQREQSQILCPLCQSTTIDRAGKGKSLGLCEIQRVFERIDSQRGTSVSRFAKHNIEESDVFSLPVEVYASNTPMVRVAMQTQTMPFDPMRLLIETNDGASAPVRLRRILLDLKGTLEKHFENVDANFPEEARRIHYGETTARNIWGRASLDDINDLNQEGILINPLPPFPREDA